MCRPASAQNTELSFFKTGKATFTQADTAQVQRLLSKATQCRYRSLDSAVLYQEAAKQYSRSCGYTDGMAQALLGLGNSFTEQGNYYQGIDHFKSAWPYCQNAFYFRNRLIILWHQNMAIPYSMLGKYDSAVFFLQQGMRYATSAKDTSSLIILMANTAGVWINNNQPAKALPYLKQAEVLATAKKENNLLPQVYNNLANVYGSLNDTACMRWYALKGLDAGKQKQNKKDQRFALTHLAKYYMLAGQPEKAVKCYEQELRLCDPGSPYTYIAPNYGLSYTYYSSLKDVHKARIYGLTALDYAGKTNLKGQMMTGLYQLLAHIHKDLGLFHKAYEFQAAYTQLNDSLNSATRNQALDELEVKYQAEKKDKALAEKQLFISRQENQIKLQRFWLLGGIAVIVTITLVFFYMYRSLKYKRQTERQAENINQLKATIAGEEKERNRLAKELHDGIGSQIMAARLKLHALKERSGIILPEELVEVHNQVNDAGDDLRKAAHNLIPDALRELGLAPAITTLCNKTEKSTGLDITFEVFNEIPRLDADMELAIYRIAQELVQNVLKHARAKSILVQLSWYNGLLQLTIEDNGIGMPEHSNTLGSGLQNIRERLCILSGNMSIQSSPCKGTTIYIECNISITQNNIRYAH